MMRPAIPALGVRFDINRIDSGSYGIECWKIFWPAVDPVALNGSVLYEGDTAASMAGRENVFCIAIQHADDSLPRAVKGALTHDPEFTAICAPPRFVEGAVCTAGRSSWQERSAVVRSSAKPGTRARRWRRCAAGVAEREERPCCDGPNASFNEEACERTQRTTLCTLATGQAVWGRRGDAVAFPWRGEYSLHMRDERESSVLDELLEPVSRCFNLDVARALTELRVNERMQARVDELAERCNEGLLTSEEEDEYEAYVQASTLIGILQAKARRILAQVQPG